MHILEQLDATLRNGQELIRSLPREKLLEMKDRILKSPGSSTAEFDYKDHSWKFSWFVDNDVIHVCIGFSLHVSEAQMVDNLE